MAVKRHRGCAAPFGGLLIAQYIRACGFFHPENAIGGTKVVLDNETNKIGCVKHKISKEEGMIEIESVYKCGIYLAIAIIT
jgi:hypothetical protein